MKRIAAILLFFFALAQVSSVLRSFLADSSYMLVIEEEKTDIKIEKGVKEKKDCIAYTEVRLEFSHSANIAIHLAEKIHLSPSPEELTPPPNFS